VPGQLPLLRPVQEREDALVRDLPEYGMQDQKIAGRVRFRQ
jgi:hypothetical protein